TLELSEVLDDPVQDDGDPVLVAAGQRMRVLFRDSPMRGPARVSEPRRGDGTVVAGRLLEYLKVADRADVVQPLVLAECEPGRVIPAILEPLETVEEKILGRSPSDVSDDPAHLKLSPFAWPNYGVKPRSRGVVRKLP